MISQKKKIEGFGQSKWHCSDLGQIRPSHKIKCSKRIIQPFKWDFVIYDVPPPPFLNPQFRIFFIVKNKVGRSGTNFILGTTSQNFEHTGAIRFFYDLPSRRI